MPGRPGACSVHVTRREAEILTLLAQGFSNAEIGVPMKITTGTVKHHICQASIKLDLHSRVLLAQYWSFPHISPGRRQGRRQGGWLVTLITETLSQGNRYSLLWIKNGVIHSLTGHGSPSDALRLAASLR